MLSAWCSEQGGLVVGQRNTDTKSNEITAIPALLQLLAIKGCIVTMDAMGCQTAIAEQIRDQGGDDLLA
jgi:predicted transposase YbfD/YdcC